MREILDVGYSKTTIFGMSEQSFFLILYFFKNFKRIVSKDVNIMEQSMKWRGWYEIPSEFSVEGNTLGFSAI